MKRRKVWVGAALMLALVLAAMLMGPVATQATGEPQLATVAKQRTFVLYPETALTDSGTVYSAAPRTIVAGQDASYSNGWASADLFVTTDVATTGSLTMTVQLSADQSNWADADYEYWTGSAIGTKTYQRVLSADGTEYVRVPLAGEYLRVKLEHSATMTPTVYLTYRN